LVIIVRAGTARIVGIGHLGDNWEPQLGKNLMLLMPQTI
jgi:hypothetical protein